MDLVNTLLLDILKFFAVPSEIKVIDIEILCYKSISNM